MLIIGVLMETSSAVSQGNFFQRNLVPDESNLVRWVMQNAAEAASSDSYPVSRVLSVAYAISAVVISFFNTFTYLLVTSCRILENVIQFEFSNAFWVLGSGLCDTTRSFILGTLGVIYVVAGAAFPEAIYGVFCPSKLPPTVAQQLGDQVEKLEQEAKELRDQVRTLTDPNNNRSQLQARSDLEEMIRIKEAQIEQLQAQLLQPSAPAQLNDGQPRIEVAAKQLEIDRLASLNALSTQLQEQLKSEIDGLRAALAETSKELGEAREQLQKITAERDRDGQENVEFQAEIQKGLEARDTEIKRLKASVEKWKTHAATLQGELDEKEAARAKWEARAKTERTSKVEWLGVHEQQQKQLEKNNDLIATKDLQIKDGRILVEQYKEQYTLAEKKVLDLTSQIEIERNKVKATLEQSNDQRVASLTADNERLAQKGLQLQDSVKKLMLENKQAKNKSLRGMELEKTYFKKLGVSLEGNSKQPTQEEFEKAVKLNQELTEEVKKLKAELEALRRAKPLPPRPVQAAPVNASKSSVALNQAFVQADAALSAEQFTPIASEVEQGRDLYFRLFTKNPPKAADEIPVEERAQDCGQ